MNKQAHVVNGLLLGVGVGVLLEPSPSLLTVDSVFAVTVPVLLGALLPDVDTTIGTHRQTLHNLATLGAFAAFPLAFGNLHWVWLGVLTHYLLDVVGTTRGIGLFYPLSDEEYGFPTGVATSSGFATPVTLVITALELVAATLIVVFAPGLVETLASVSAPVSLPSVPTVPLPPVPTVPLRSVPSLPLSASPAG